jgi:hemolysin III
MQREILFRVTPLHNERMNPIMFSKLREPVSGLTHLGGAVAALAGQIVLLVLGWPMVEKVVAVLVYGLSLVGLFSASAAYHLVNAGPKVTAALRKLDHSAIYLLIAGSYTPFCLLAFEGFFRWGMLAIVWSFAIVGIIVKLFYMDAPRWVSAVIYLLMGWLCVFAAGEMFNALPVFSLAWMIVGGVIYSLGAVVYATKIFDFAPGKFGFHEVWHIFVLLGALAHFIAVLGVVSPM